MRHWRRTRRAQLDEDFREWALARQAHLRRSAYLLCRDWHLAEDLTQTTLAKMYAAWNRVREGDGREAYARRVLYRTFVDETRRGYRREHTGVDLPDPGVPADDPALRMALLDAVAHLPPRCRAVILLRFWEDQSVEDTAAALGCTTGTVKSQTSRGLAALRQRLRDDGGYAGYDGGTGGAGMGGAGMGGGATRVAGAPPRPARTTDLRLRTECGR
ncbi:SigE family RNA polymerase sigma factor [Yinghuangia seranimata]|uniref:SigE family RNA polymerase sigma factor n=1 Tax=Yinghuangia seranimata TaxID=408067 RepID=UPI00248C1E6E|nr:SigE family RNA polymerase sigma factor [Yinghuangia seranimata]MDI2132537.1 SigE family RNA polymerase sigma factor [Yinghuangia seranimata]